MKIAIKNCPDFILQTYLPTDSFLLTRTSIFEAPHVTSISFFIEYAEFCIKICLGKNKEKIMILWVLKNHKVDRNIRCWNQKMSLCDQKFAVFWKNWNFLKCRTIDGLSDKNWGWKIFTCLVQWFPLTLNRGGWLGKGKIGF